MIHKIWIFFSSFFGFLCGEFYLCVGAYDEVCV